MNEAAAKRESLLKAAELLLPRYREATGGLSHEPKGIRRSEMFFFYASVAALNPARIVESGRARAQSTLVLARLFPGALIVSLESNASSPDVAIASERLREHPNFECLFGDSLRLLPELVEPGDVVLIDGPKDFRALKLAFRLLKSGKPAVVFVHDLWLGSPARRFVDRDLGRALCDARFEQALAPRGIVRQPPRLWRNSGLFRSGLRKLLAQASPVQRGAGRRSNPRKRSQDSPPPTAGATE